MWTATGGNGHLLVREHRRVVEVCGLVRRVLLRVDRGRGRILDVLEGIHRGSGTRRLRQRLPVCLQTGVQGQARVGRRGRYSRRERGYVRGQRERASEYRSDFCVAWGTISGICLLAGSLLTTAA